MTEAESTSERLWKRQRNIERSEQRRMLYRTDPIWRLTKLKDNWERRERKRRGLV
jgi:hypothetical protein